MTIESLKYHIKPNEFEKLPVDWEEVFGRKAPLFVEIGFGNGEFLIYLAKEYPNVNIVGFELSLTSFVKAQKKLYDEGIENVRLVMTDGRFGLRELFTDNSVKKVYVNFPCPWSKKGHEDRRVTAGDFVETLASVLEMGGEFELATDDERYASEVHELLSKSDFFGVEPIHINPDRKVKTRYERKWIEDGRTIHIIRAKKVKNVSVKRLTWEESAVHVKIESLNEERIPSLKGKVYKGKNDRVFVVKEVFKDFDGEKYYMKIISSDKGFDQHYNLILEKKRNFWVLKIDSTCHPYRTPTVKWSLYKIKEELSNQFARFK